VARHYEAPPPLTIVASHRYEALLETERGALRIALRPDLAPQAVNSFVFLATEGYFDGCAFHRVVPGFIAQAGDPTGTGRGTPGYRIEDELTDESFAAASVGMANAGSGSAGSQFFVALADLPHLDGRFTLFGQVEEGMGLLAGLERRERADEPPGALVISSIRVVETAATAEA
jgi:cyclophilin family peptidyl-prolyl cis-trans isomerase